MPTNFLFFESIRKQLLKQGYYSIVIVNKHEGPEQCFLSKKQFLPDILLETNYLMVPLTGSYAVDIIEKHFVDKLYDKSINDIRNLNINVNPKIESNIDKLKKRL